MIYYSQEAYAFQNFVSESSNYLVFKTEKFTKFDHFWGELCEAKVRSMNFKFIQVWMMFVDSLETMV